MRPYVAPVSMETVTPYHPVDDEPESEAVCGVPIGAGGYPKGMPPPTALVEQHQSLPSAVLEIKGKDDEEGAVLPSTCSIDADIVAEAVTGAAAEDVGRKFFRVARELMAKRAVERHLRKRPRAKSKKQGKACFEHLPCCFEMMQMRESLADAENHIAHLDQELRKALLRAPAEESSPEAPSAAIQEEFKTQLEKVTARGRVEVEELRQQLSEQRAELAEMKQQARQARREAAEYRAKLAVYREADVQETAEALRRPQSQTDEAADAASTAEGAALERRNKALEELLKAAAQKSEEAEQQLKVERAMHQQEVDRLTGQLQASRPTTNASALGHPDDEDDAPLTREEELEEKMLQVACEKLQADRALHERKEADALLMRKCMELHGPATRLMGICKKSPLPPLPQSSEDPTAHSVWVGVLARGLGEVCTELQAHEESS